MTSVYCKCSIVSVSSLKEEHLSSGKLFLPIVSNQCYWHYIILKVMIVGTSFDFGQVSTIVIQISRNW